MTDVTERPAARQDPVRRGSTINLRVETETRDLIDAATSIVGKTRTEVMIETARRHATNVFLDQRLFVLTPDQHDAFTHALDNPRPAGGRLGALMKRRPPWEA
ncbi:DUF1778 domain-containing protein [Methylobacterium sp. E-005]|uniref:type II toxin-antitoxin system TacA family antitoxin n=1 Tax=Methylobacterium sp. E-005 TaxID=2836549 RepID=UPI001FBBB96B|nr:DUF1778 domain-containing protein [Methylobacterium sp. E-005]MCJ2090305.1 DUF1778 domain-containing protein [Methylobacterium sp. E-005]